MAQTTHIKHKSKSVRNMPLRSWRNWHKKLGVFSAFFIIILSATGIALNHTDTLKLGHQPITSTWLLDHYGIKPPQNIKLFKHNQHDYREPIEVTIADAYIWLNKKLIGEVNEPIISVAFIRKNILVIAETQIQIFNNQGELIDSLDKSLGLPIPIENVAVNGYQLGVKTPEGYYQSDEIFFSWQSYPMSKSKWIVPSKATDEEIHRVSNQYRSQFLSIERVILDAHAGRIFGQVGVWFMDVIAVMLILLSFSGCYLWLKQSKKK